MMLIMYSVGIGRVVRTLGVYDLSIVPSPLGWTKGEPIGAERVLKGCPNGIGSAPKGREVARQVPKGHFGSKGRKSI